MPKIPATLCLTQPHSLLVFTARSYEDSLSALGEQLSHLCLLSTVRYLTHRAPCDVIFCPLVFRSPDICHYFCDFPPGPQGAAGDKFHSHLRPQVVEPVTGELEAGLNP